MMGAAPKFNEGLVHVDIARREGLEQHAQYAGAAWIGFYRSVVVAN